LRPINEFVLKALFYGLLAIGMSFGVGNAGNVLQASIGLVGSMVGPLFALFVLGILYPYATAPVVKPIVMKLN
jgi:hypothetical protein